MTNSSRFGSRPGKASARVLLIALALASAPMFALAQQTPQNGTTTPAKPASPPPRPVVIHQDTSYQRAMQQQQQVQNQLQKNAVQNQVRQNNANQVLNQTTDPALRSQLGNANASQQQLQQAKQQAVIDRYRAQPAVTDPAVRQQQQQQQQQEAKPADQEGE
jgi:hypothetical protein